MLPKARWRCRTNVHPPYVLRRKLPATPPRPLCRARILVGGEGVLEWGKEWAAAFFSPFKNKFISPTQTRLRATRYSSRLTVTGSHRVAHTTHPVFTQVGAHTRGCMGKGTGGGGRGGRGWTGELGRRRSFGRGMCVPRTNGWTLTGTPQRPGGYGCRVRLVDALVPVRELKPQHIDSSHIWKIQSTAEGQQQQQQGRWDAQGSKQARAACCGSRALAHTAGVT
jgi:hypothetical protein